MGKEAKTNAMRILEREKIPYTAHEYEHGDGAIDGVSVAQKMGEDPACVYKTLVTRGASGNYFVFVVPVADVYIAHMDGGHVQLITAKGELRSNNRLYELESTLGEGFVRISKSAIVNIDAIDRIEPGFGGALSVQMVDGSVEWISRRFLGAFKQAIGMGCA